MRRHQADLQLHPHNLTADLFTVVGKHKAHRGAVWEVQGKRSGYSWNFRHASQGVGEFCAWRLASSAYGIEKIVHLCRQTQSALGCCMGGSREKVWLFVEFSSRLTGGWRVLRLAVSEFCSNAGSLFTFVGKHKAHRGAVWEAQGKGSGSSWNFRHASQGVGEFCAWRSASSAYGAGNLFTFVGKMAGFTGKGLVLPTILIRPPALVSCARLASSAVGVFSFAKTQSALG